MRLILALMAATAVGSVAALILGEYEMTLFTGLASGIGVGAVLAETVLAVGRRRTLVTMGAAVTLAAGSMLWASWIDAGRGVEPIRATAWLGVALAAATAAVRLRPRA